MSGIEDVLDQDPRENYREPVRPKSVTPLQREVEPPPTCSRCDRAITMLTDYYRCAQCDAAFHRACIYEHFGWGVNDKPHPAVQAPTAGEPRDPARAFAYWFSAQPWGIQRRFVHDWIDRHEPGEGPPYNESPQPSREAEAARAAVQELRERIEAGAATADHGSIEDGPAFARGARWAASLLEPTNG